MTAVGFVCYCRTKKGKTHSDGVWAVETEEKWENNGIDIKNNCSFFFAQLQ